MAAAPFLIATTAMSGASQYLGARNAGSAARASGDYSAAVFGMNADIADEQAKDAIARGAEAEQRSRADTRGALGEQRVGFAAQGVDLASGSAADVQGDTAYLGELDALTIRNNAKREAWGYTVEGTNYRAQGQLARVGGRNAQRGANMQAYSTLLTTAADISQIGKQLPRTKKA